ncbi:Pectinesterase inhibitor [Morella rubra]|uniref:Pectinesterase inhibitor n=1 Tax=Morella rubra TaxID=262757 RepID=A0A6A1VZZ2_9ROSI|nr:Pectinesterase inhibitor [Morella rubra]
MAIKLSVSLSLLMISAVLSLLHPSESRGIASGEKGKPLITKTCSRTEFPDICTSTLESDPRSLNADLTGLSRIALELVEAKANEAAVVAYKLLNSAPDYPTWSDRSACFYSYNSTVYRIKQEGLQDFDARKYDKVGVLNQVNGEILHCNTLNVPELKDSNTIISRFITDVKKILSFLS